MRGTLPVPRTIGARDSQFADVRKRRGLDALRDAWVVLIDAISELPGDCARRTTIAQERGVKRGWRACEAIETRYRTRRLGGETVLWTIFVILLVLWLVGVVSSYTLGGYIHLLLLIALVVLVLRLISGRRVV
jgi:hypothetical protein